MDRDTGPDLAPARRRVRLLGLFLLGLGALHAADSRAVPSYARQTQQPCTGCHVGGFGPQLTAFGRQFKLSGYTLKVGETAHLPLSAMVVESWTHTARDQADPPAAHFGRNDNTELQQASVFLAGRLGEHLGAFAQATYSENGAVLGWDNAELRYARTFTGTHHDGVWGLTLNNNPTVTDVLNTAPAWQYPFMAADLAPEAPAAPLLFGGLGGQVVGATAYAQVDGKWYFEAGGYRTLSPAFLRHVNADYDGRLSGLAPYARLTRNWDAWGGNVTLGAFALSARRGLTSEDAGGRVAPVPGPTDRFRDFGVDASYQNLGDGTHAFTVNALAVHERQRLDATFPAGGAEHRDGTLRAYNLNGSYWYRNTWGATTGVFAYDGSSDALLYPDTGAPDTRGGIAELDWNPFGQSGSWGQPWANLRVGLQYTWYTRFSGATHDIDGAGRSAHDNNTTFLYVWLAL
ncbi:MAG TPA: cytochrome C [Xanthomonadaceae bacterium]|nr:cytochrome C [Xanthomonadaceae bacterium]